jgi:hypothetical protein
VERLYKSESKACLYFINYLNFIIMSTLNLNAGEMMLVSAKGVNGGKVSLTFAQVVETEKSTVSLTSLLNASDARFNQMKPRYAWITGEPKDIQNTFGFDVSGLAVGETLEVGMLNPEINGQRLNILITETTEGNEYEVANFETTAKRAGKDGDFILTQDGLYIYQRTSVVVGPVAKTDHKIIKDTVRKAPNAGTSAIQDALGL